MTLTNNSDIFKIFQVKLDKQIFTKAEAELTDQVETVRNATYDNFRQILSTDNYLEKYLPFKLQSMISSSLFSILPKRKPLIFAKESEGKYQGMTLQE